MIATDIKIRAEIQQHDASSCKFVVDRPLFVGFASFSTKERAEGSPLAKRLMAIEGIIGVQISENTVMIRKQNFEDWRMIGPMIGSAVREHILSGQPAVSPEAVNALPADDVLRGRIQKVIDEQINPAVASHGGTITLLDVQNARVFIKMGGGCQGCASANVTLRSGVERALRDSVPEIVEILDASDHAAGTNPYYAPAH